MVTGAPYRNTSWPVGLHDCTVPCLVGWDPFGIEFDLSGSCWLPPDAPCFQERAFTGRTSKGDLVETGIQSLSSDSCINFESKSEITDHVFHNGRVKDLFSFRQPLFRKGFYRALSRTADSLKHAEVPAAG